MRHAWLCVRIVGMSTSFRPISILTSVALAAAAGLHVAWGRGSPFPFRSQAELTDNVAGSSDPPSPSACYGVAALLAMAAATVVATPRRGVHRRLLQIMSAVFAGRSVAGFAGRTDILVPGSDSPLFRRRDRRIYAPLCALLSVGIWSSSRPSR